MLGTLFAASLLAIAFLLHCAAVGSAIPAGLVTDRGPGSAALNVFFNVCLGMLVNMAGLFVLGVTGYFHLAGVAGLALVLLGVAVAVRWSRRRDFDPRASAATSATSSVSETSRASPEPAVSAVFALCTTPWRAPRLELIALALLFGLTLMVALHPPGHWDDTMYHLVLARNTVEHHGFVLNEYLRFPLFPQNFNLLFALGLMLGELSAPAWAYIPDSVSAAALASAVTAAPGASASGPAAATMLLSPDLLWRFGLPEVFAQVFATLPLFVMVLGLWAASHRWLNSGLPGLLAGVLLFMIRPVKSTLGFAYVDNGLAMFCLAAALGAACIIEALRPRGDSEPVSRRSWVIGWAAVGLLAGAACGTKYFGVVFATLLGGVVALATWVAIRATPSRRDGAPATVSSLGGTLAATPVASTIWAVLSFGLAVLLAGSAWYVRSYLISGDPAHPAGASVFGFFLWNEGDLVAQHTEQAGHGVARNLLMLPAALLQAGVLPWLPALLGLFLPRLPPAIRSLQAIFVAYLLFWFIVTQVSRYLAPIYGLGCFLSLHACYVVWRLAGQRLQPQLAPWRAWRARRAYRQWPYAAWVVLLLCLGFTIDRGAKNGSEFRHSEEVLSTRAGYSLYQQANLHRGLYGDRLVQLEFENGVYFFLGTVIGDWFGPGRYRDLLSCEALPCPLPPWQTLEATLRKHGAQMLLLNRPQADQLPGRPLAEGWRVLASNHEGVLLGYGSVHSAIHGR